MTDNNAEQIENAPLEAAPEAASTPATKERPRYATHDNPSIEAIVNGLYRLPNEEQAQKRIEQLRNYFTVSSQSPENALIMWIKGYDVTPEEALSGCIGNYALIYPEQGEDKRWSVVAKKIEAEPAYHPQRKRKLERYPNWGHPLMRQIKRGRVFETIDETRNMLMRLHEDFPEVTIPTLNKLYVMIYSRGKEEKASIKKFVLEIKVQPEGGYKIEAYENNYKNSPFPKTAPKPMPEKAEPAKEIPVGFFTSKVEMARKKRK